MFFNITVLLFNNSYCVNLDKILFFLFTFIVLSAIFKILYINIRSDLVNKTISIIKKKLKL
jgi:hypothetical protein